MAAIAEKDQQKEAAIYYFKIELAGKKIEVECTYKRVFYFCREYLSTFDKPDFVISLTAKDIDNEKRISKKVVIDRDGIELDLPEYYEITAANRKIAERLLCDNIIMLHGAAIAVKNKCYIFTAPSGTGKTTHIMSWLKMIPGAFVVNGDKPLIDIGKRLVYGTPWCGKENMNTNTAVPIAGIIALERGDNNKLLPVEFKEMLPTYLQQVYIPNEQDAAIQAYKLIEKLKDIPCYKLSCNMKEESALVAYRALNSGTCTEPN